MLLGDRIEELLIEDRDMLKAAVVAILTFLGFILTPVKLST